MFVSKFALFRGHFPGANFVYRSGPDLLIIPEFRSEKLVEIDTAFLRVGIMAFNAVFLEEVCCDVGFQFRLNRGWQ